MRSYNHISILALLLFVMHSYTATAQRERLLDPLVGSWALDYNTTFSKMESHMKILMDTIPQAQRRGVENSYRGRTMIFGPDGNFKMLFSDGRSVGGSWKVEQDGNLLVLTDPNGKRHLHQVKAFSANEMVLRMEDSGEAKLFVKELYFIKN